MDCPRCGTPMEGGVCPECGFPVIQIVRIKRKVRKRNDHEKQSFEKTS